MRQVRGRRKTSVAAEQSATLRPPACAANELMGDAGGPKRKTLAGSRCRRAGAILRLVRSEDETTEWIRHSKRRVEGHAMATAK